MNTKHRNTRNQFDLFTATTAAEAMVAPHPHRPMVAPPRLSSRYAIPCFSVRLVRERDHLTEQITSPADAARVACEMLEDKDREHFLVLALSTSGRLIGAHVAHVGSLDASIACGREVYRFAILVNAKSIVVAHNHPSGNLEPSRADVSVTQQLKAAGEALSIPLVDHVIVGFGRRYTSLAQRGLL